jgi:Flp pilus assembly protein TadB
MLDNLLFVIAGIIVIIWAIAFIGMEINSGIHVLLIIAANLIMLGIIQHQKIKKTI